MKYIHQKIKKLENKETHKNFNIGSTCVSNWIYKNQHEDRNCLFCNRNNKSGENCKNCKEKTKIYFRIEVIYVFLPRLENGLDFGKYMNLVTYNQLCRQKCYEDYVSFILSDSCWIVMQDVKDKIIKFLN